MLHARRPLRTAAVVTTAVFAMTSWPALTIASGRAPAARSTVPVAAEDRWTPPRPGVDTRFATLSTDHTGHAGGVWLVPRAQPLRFSVESDVVATFGWEAVRAGVEAWNHVAGGRLTVVLGRATEDRAGTYRQDGDSRILFSEEPCGGARIGHAELWPSSVIDRHGSTAVHVGEVDIALCAHRAPRDVSVLLAHEVGHAIGLGHLCDPGRPCWLPAMGRDGNACRIMSPRLNGCNAPTEQDRDAVVHLYPALPRLGGDDPATTAAWASWSNFPEAGSAPRVVLVAADADEADLAAGAGYAAALRVPFLLLGGACLGGPADAELQRVLASDGDMLLVGPQGEGCAALLSDVRGAPLERLENPAAVALAVADEVGSGAVVVARGSLPTAVAIAGRTRAPLLIVDPLEGPDLAARVLLARDSVRRVVTVGRSPLEVLDRDVVSITGWDEVSVAGAARREASFGFDGAAIVVAGPSAAERITAAVTSAVRGWGLVLPDDARELDWRESSAVTRADGGVLVADRGTVPEPVEAALSRLIDADVAPAGRTPPR